jgi:hypothetical protein
MAEPIIEHTQFKRSDLLKLSGRFDSSQAPRVEALLQRRGFNGRTGL